jgi:hypothetical protein
MFVFVFIPSSDVPPMLSHVSAIATPWSLLMLLVDSAVAGTTVLLIDGVDQLIEITDDAVPQKYSSRRL